jgi:hypothetical protein
MPPRAAHSKAYESKLYRQIHGSNRLISCIQGGPQMIHQGNPLASLNLVGGLRAARFSCGFHA